MSAAVKLQLMIAIGGVALGFLGASAFSCRSERSKSPPPLVDVSSERMRVKYQPLTQPTVVQPPQAHSIPLDTEGHGPHAKAAQARDFMQMKINVPQWALPPLPKVPAGEPQKHRLKISATPSDNVGGGSSSLSKAAPFKGGNKSKKAEAASSQAIIGTS